MASNKMTLNFNSNVGSGSKSIMLPTPFSLNITVKQVSFKSARYILGWKHRKFAFDVPYVVNLDFDKLGLPLETQMTANDSSLDIAPAQQVLNAFIVSLRQRHSYFLSAFSFPTLHIPHLHVNRKLIFLSCIPICLLFRFISLRQWNTHDINLADKHFAVTSLVSC